MCRLPTALPTPTHLHTLPLPPHLPFPLSQLSYLSPTLLYLFLSIISLYTSPIPLPYPSLSLSSFSTLPISLLFYPLIYPSNASPSLSLFPSLHCLLFHPAHPFPFFLLFSLIHFTLPLPLLPPFLSVSRFPLFLLLPSASFSPFVSSFPLLPRLIHQ